MLEFLLNSDGQLIRHCQHALAPGDAVYLADNAECQYFGEQEQFYLKTPNDLKLFRGIGRKETYEILKIL